jgi:hypothetical protein
MAKIKESLLRVRCPHCRAAVLLAPSIVNLGGRAALLCPECHEVSVAQRP